MFRTPALTLIVTSHPLKSSNQFKHHEHTTWVKTLLALSSHHKQKLDVKEQSFCQTKAIKPC